ncbi:hypothetical protein BDV30DRAFT_236877 [Aspergillus minisclerotigenes]|uniref:Uncharacterized protein n=1 Tax=Aspergillus minisclerotigenes TaxID=656917 RepID=A0A5N6J8T2_9EURO|nr:hypothetical protein BDV30DRAFT_236877 [Aspergillus minisclerotigenes]
MRVSWLVSGLLAVYSAVASPFPEDSIEARSIFPKPSPCPRGSALSQSTCRKCFGPFPRPRESVTFDQIVDLLTLPKRFIVDIAERFGQGFVGLVAGKTCRAVSEISIPGVYAAITECIEKPAFQAVFHTIEKDITDFLKYPVIHEGWEFLNMRLEDIPVIGDVIKDVGKAEGWVYNNLVPSFARQKIQTCIDDVSNNSRHASGAPWGWELAETINASKIALKAAEAAAKSADGAVSIAKAVEA